VHTQNIALIPDCISEQLNGGKRSGGGNNSFAGPLDFQAATSIDATNTTGGINQISVAINQVVSNGPLATGAITINNNQYNMARPW
jgi:hypothetical protein